LLFQVTFLSRQSGLLVLLLHDDDSELLVSLVKNLFFRIFTAFSGKIDKLVLMD
jgi:hypothetical protein